MTYNWNFGNGSTSSAGSSVSQFYNQAGCYDISLTVTDPTNGCSNTVTYPSLICVIPQPVAAFSTQPAQLESYNNFVGYQIIKTIEMFNPIPVPSVNRAFSALK